MEARHVHKCRGFKSTVVGVCLGSAFVTVGFAQEITNFKFTGYEASVSTSVQSDASSTVAPIGNSTDVIMTDQRQTDVRLESSLMTHSYVYHPKFLSLDMGVGVIESKNTYQANGLTAETREPLYNFSLHGSVLSEKPLRGTFFYDSINATPAVSSEESINKKSNKYGLTTTLAAPLSPVDMLLDVTREVNTGANSTTTLDEKIDRVGLSARKTISKYGATDLRYNSVKQNLNNGLIGQSIPSYSQDSQVISADTRLRLGTTTQYDVNNRIEYSTQKYGVTQGAASEIKDARFGLDYRGYHSSSFNSFANLQSNRTDFELSSNKSNAVSGGATWVVAKDFDVTGGAHAGSSQATEPGKQFSNRTMGVDASTRYTRALAIGTGAMNYNIRYEQFDQTTSGDPISKKDLEEVAMRTISSPSTLSYPNVTALIEVRSKGQVFTSGVDYVTRLSGNRTTIYFMPEVFSLGVGGVTFTEGDIVLVTYTYDNGGTYGSAQLDQSIGFTWTLSPRFNVFAQYSDASPRVISGKPSIALNQIKSIWYGLRVSVPLSVRYDLVLTSNIDQEDRRVVNEVEGTTGNSSYVRSSGDFYLRGELPTTFSNDYRMGVRRVHLVADDPTQSVDQTSYELAFGWRTNNGLNMVATALMDRDSNAGIERDSNGLSLRALWRYRRFYATAELARTRETQGLYARDRTVGRLALRRDL